MIIFLSQLLSDLSLAPLPPSNFISSASFSNPPNLICVIHILMCVRQSTGTWLMYQGLHPWRKVNLPNSHQAHDPLAISCWNVGWFDLFQTLLSSCEGIYSYSDLVMSRRHCFFLVLVSSDFCYPLASFLLHYGLWADRGGDDKIFLLMTEYPTDINSLYFIEVWIYVLIVFHKTPVFDELWELHWYMGIEFRRHFDAMSI